MQLFRILLSTLLLVSAAEVAAQEARTYPYKTIEYFDVDKRKLSGPEGAHIRIESTYRDSLSGSVRVYNGAGKLKTITPYAHMDGGVRLGPETSYYETGELHTKNDYVGNKRNGEFVVYFKDGKVKRRERYQNDVRITGECFDHESQPAVCTEYEVMPTYKGGGFPEMVKAIQMSVKYPHDALMKQIEGKVFFTFVVGINGEIQEIRVTKGLSPSLDAEVVRSVRALRGVTHGMQDGEPVPVAFSSSVTFAIQ
jgi:protein TonB